MHLCMQKITGTLGLYLFHYLDKFLLHIPVFESVEHVTKIKRYAWSSHFWEKHASQGKHSTIRRAH